MRKITKLDGTLFPTKLSTTSQASLIAKKEGGDKADYVVAEVEGGFIIVAPDLKEEIQPQVTAVDEPVVASAPEAPSGTEPAPKHKVTKPWTPSRKLNIPDKYKDSRFNYRFVNKDKQGRVRQLENDGYEVDTDIQKKMTGYEKQHGQNLDSTYQINELIVMRILKTEYAAHRKYYSDLANNARSQNEEEVRAEMQKGGLKLYKPKEATM